MLINLFEEEMEFMARKQAILEEELFGEEVNNLAFKLSKKLKLGELESDSCSDSDGDIVEEKRFVSIKNDIMEEERLTEILKQERIDEQVRKHENNSKKICHMTMTVQTPIKINFYINCEKCSNTVSACAWSRKWTCSEYCNGCKSVFCYECIPRVERFCEINLGSKMIKVRDPSDKRYNCSTSIDAVSKIGNNYCKKCAFEKVESGNCMIRVKEWEEKKLKNEFKTKR